MEDSVTIRISLDGAEWCALIGQNLMEGLAGFGNSPAEAIKALCDEIQLHGWNLPRLLLW